MSDLKIQTIDDTILGILANKRYVSIDNILSIYLNNDLDNNLKRSLFSLRCGILSEENKVETIVAENQNGELYYLLNYVMVKPTIDNIKPTRTTLELEYHLRLNVKYEYRIGTSSGSYGDWKDASSYPLIIEKIGDVNLTSNTSYFIKIRYFRIIDDGPTIYSEPSDEKEGVTLT